MRLAKPQLVALPNSQPLIESNERFASVTCLPSCVGYQLELSFMPFSSSHREDGLVVPFQKLNTELISALDHYSASANDDGVVN